MALARETTTSLASPSVWTPFQWLFLAATLLRQPKQSRLRLCAGFPFLACMVRLGVEIRASYLLCFRCSFSQYPLRGGRVVSESVIEVALWPQPVFLLEETNEE